MEREIIHPHEAMADFVNRYERKIKPALEKGDTDEIKKMKIYLSLADEIIFKNPKFIRPKKGVGQYFMRLQNNMESLLDIEPKGEFFEEMFAALERNVAYIDLILGNDSYYQRFREEEKQ